MQHGWHGLTFARLHCILPAIISHPHALTTSSNDFLKHALLNSVITRVVTMQTVIHLVRRSCSHFFWFIWVCSIFPHPKTHENSRKRPKNDRIVASAPQSKNVRRGSSEGRAAAILRGVRGAAAAQPRPRCGRAAAVPRPPPRRPRWRPAPALVAIFFDNFQ